MITLAEVLCIGWLVGWLMDWVFGSWGSPPSASSARFSRQPTLPPPPPPPMAHPDYGNNSYVGFNQPYAGRVHDYPQPAYGGGGVALGVPAFAPSPLPAQMQAPLHPPALIPTMEVTVGPSSRSQAAPSKASEHKDGYEAPSAPPADD